MEDRRKLLNDFLDAFPLETLKDMPLENKTSNKKTLDEIYNKWNS